LVNQYFFQAYVIPSGSMKNTLLIEDRIFVNKFLFGPEILPGVGKIPGFVIPKRGDTIIFENPDFLTKGVFYDVFQRIIYMATLSLVDLDQGEIRLLIKRGVAADGDAVRFKQGFMEIRPAGEERWIPESEFQQMTHTGYQIRRLLSKKHDEKIQTFVQKKARFDQGLIKVSPDMNEIAEWTEEGRLMDPMAFNHHYAGEALRLNPMNLTLLEQFYKVESGFFVPKGWILPLGDNRDNSKDGRWFGPIPKNKVLGQAALRYWPLSTFGGIQ